MIRNFVSRAAIRTSPFACAAAALFITGSAASAQVKLDRLNHGIHEFDAPTNKVVMAANGGYMVVETAATNVSVVDNNGMSDIFLIELPSGFVRMVSHTATAPGLDGGNGPSFDPAVSADGLWVAFSSDATNLVAGDTNGQRDIFLFDRSAPTGTPVTRISVDTFGTPANGASDHPSISEDGRWIAFDTLASNLAAGDANGVRDVYLRDMITPFTLRISLAPVGEPNNHSERPAIDASSGFYVAYQSRASNIVAGDTNGVADIFVAPRGGASVLVSRVGGTGAVGNAVSQNASISYWGDWIAFESVANNLVSGELPADFDLDVFLYDRQSPNLQRVSSDPFGQPTNGASFNAQISRDHPLTQPFDGQYVAFQSTATNLTSTSASVADEVYVFDRFASPAITLESVTSTGGLPTAICTQPSVGVGACLAFLSADDNMVSTETTTGDVDAFLKLVPVTTPTRYGDARTYNGCAPTMSSTGTPSTTLPSAFTVSTTSLPGHTTSGPLGDGYFFYSVTAPHNAPISGSLFTSGPNIGLPNGLLLAEPSTFRVQPPFSTGGTTGQCNGSAAFNFNPLIQSGSNPALTLGAQVWVQTYCRDPSPLGRTYSDALWFVIQ